MFLEKEICQFVYLSLFSAANAVQTAEVGRAANCSSNRLTVK